jgi:two-component system OmpR family response regulator
MDLVPHILVVDDHKDIRELLGRFLRQHGFKATTARDGFEMRECLAQQGPVDLVVLDLMLPGDDGLTLCRELRGRSAIPIIILTAMGDETDRIVGLEMGADDYLAKPFNPRELLARIRAVLRRVAMPADGSAAAPRTGGRILRFAGWTIDLVRRELHSPDGVLVELTAGEYDLLTAFAEHPQRVLSRDQLLDITRSRSAAAFDRTIDVQVSRLRRKIENGGDPPMIKTVRGAGYVFAVTVERP